MHLLQLSNQEEVGFCSDLLYMNLNMIYLIKVHVLVQLSANISGEPVIFLVRQGCKCFKFHKVIIVYVFQMLSGCQ